jgi:hypothetical protein
MLRRLLILAVLAASSARPAEPPMFGIPSPEEPARLTPDEAERLQRYLQYPSLTRLTKETRIEMAPQVSALCVRPVMDTFVGPGPHAKAAIRLYANDRAIEAVGRWTGGSRFPIGTLLVKEKFETTTDSAPSGITVMEKVADQGKVEDWLFYAIRLPKVSIVRERAKVSCEECHADNRLTDFVSAKTFSYLWAYARKQAGQPPAPVPAGQSG